MKDLRKFTTVKTLDIIKRDAFFKKQCVEKLFFLIEDREFRKIQAENFGKGSAITFSKGKSVFPKVIVEYEMGTLPTAQIELGLKEKIRLSEEKNIKNYPTHFSIRQIVNKEISSIDKYIKELGDVWKEKEKEIYVEVGECLSALAFQINSILVNKRR